MHATRTRAAAAAIAFATSTLAALAVEPNTVSAATFVVNTLSDNPVDGDTLREAIQAANLAAGPDVITFTAGLNGTIDITTQLDIIETLRITGPGSEDLTVDANGLDRVFHSMTPGTSLTMSGMTITGGDTAGPGGGIVFQSGNSLRLVDIVVTGNSAVEGGGIDISNILGSASMTDVTVSDNTATTSSGGGIDADDIALGVILTNVTISGNESLADNGGGARFEGVGGVAQLTDVTVSNNTASQDVGGIFLEAAGDVLISELDAASNTAEGGSWGGGYMGSGADLSIADSRFSRNGAANYGAFEIDASGLVTVTSTQVVDNVVSASVGGGAIAAAGVLVENSTFSRNTAGSQIGGLAIEADAAEVSKTTINGNDATFRPGLALLLTANSAISNSTISDNTSPLAAPGAGLHVISSSDELTIWNTTISGNSTAGTGAAISADTTDVFLDWSTVADNTAGGASGMFNSVGGATVSYDHSIVAGNTGVTYDDASPATLSASYSLVQSSPAVIVLQDHSLFGVDPQLGPLAFNGGPTRTHLPKATSPVVDAGDPGIAFIVGATDQRGMPRQVGTVDMGSVERQVSDSPVWLPVTPARLVETRPGFDTIDGKNEAIGRRAAGATLEFDVAGRAGVPNDARAVIVNITGIDAPTRGYLTAHPCLATRPNASSLNFPADIRVGNEVIAELDDDGHMCIFTYVATHLTVDVTGYVPAESPYVPVAPARLADTRPGFDTIDGIAEGGGRPGAGNTLTLQVAGRGDVPIGASAVVINATAVDAATNGYITVHPCVATPPNASSLNHIGGVNRGNEIVARLNATGKLCIFTKSNIHVTIDVVGYLPPDTDYTPLPAPVRLLDTRPGFSTIDGQFQGGGPRPAGSTLTLDIRSRAGIPDEITSVALNLTAVGATANGYATVFACNGPRPNASSLNFRAGINGGNEIIAGLSPTGKVCIYTHRVTHLTVDVAGYTTLES